MTLIESIGAILAIYIVLVSSILLPYCTLQCLLHHLSLQKMKKRNVNPNHPKVSQDSCILPRCAAVDKQC